MTFFKKVRSAFILPIIGVIFLGQGCVGSTPNVLDGGVFRTADNGMQWTQLKIYNLGTKLGSLADLGTVTLAVDPQDSQALYLGTVQNGLMTSLDGGDSWTPMKGMTTGKITSIVVDPKSKCTVYAARANQLMKTTDCGRDWNQIYFDPRTDKVMTSLAIDWFNPRVIYMGSSDGDILRSEDGGTTWKSVTRVDGIRIQNIAIDPRDSRVAYASTNGAGIVKTTDSGATWTKIVDVFKDFEGARRPNAVVLDPLRANRVYTISKYGILRSEDGGSAWKALALPTPNGSIDIRALAIHPRNSKAIVYATDTSVVFSVNDGATWTAKKLPTTRGTAFLTFSAGTTPALFLGAIPPKQ